MEWQEVKVETTTPGIEPISGQLLNLGVNGWVVEDPEDFKEFLNREDKNWDYIADELLARQTAPTKIIFYLAANGQGAETLLAVKHSLANLKGQYQPGVLGSLAITVNNRDQSEWEDCWKQYYKPFKVGKSLVVKPSWEQYNSPSGEDRKILEIDPNASFGTGQHYTTRLCLEAIEEAVHPGARVLDVGCGTGILGIGAMLLGAKNAVGVDIEEHSMTTSKANALKNCIADEAYISYCGNVLTDSNLVGKIGTGYDLLTANIIADVIIAMSGLFNQFLKTDGRLICSGIIDVRGEEVRLALEVAGFEIIEVKSEGGWLAIVADKVK